MQILNKELKKVEKKLLRGDKKKIAERLAIPYTNVTTAFNCKAGIELSFDVLNAAKKLILQREKVIRRKIKSVKY